MEAKGEQLLQELVSQEQALVKRLEASKKRAAKIIDDAHAESASIMALAKEKSEATLRQYTAQAKAEAQKIHDEILSKARQQVEAAQAQAKKGMKKAVNFVVERVLP